MHFGFCFNLTVAKHIIKMLLFDVVDPEQSLCNLL